MPRTVTPRTATPTDHADLTLDLPRLRTVLEEQRRFRVEQLATLSAQDGQARAELLGRHVDDLDASAESSRVEMSAVLTAGARQSLADIDAALARMDSGAYGSCEGCHNGIQIERLWAVPQAALCVACQHHAESGR